MGTGCPHLWNAGGRGKNLYFKYNILMSICGFTAEDQCRGFSHLWGLFFCVVSIPRGRRGGGVWQHCEWWSPLPTLLVHWGHWNHEAGKRTHTYLVPYHQWAMVTYMHPFTGCILVLNATRIFTKNFSFCLSSWPAVEEKPREKTGLWWKGCRGGEEAAVLQSECTGLSCFFACGMQSRLWNGNKIR